MLDTKSILDTERTPPLTRNPRIHRLVAIITVKLNLVLSQMKSSRYYIDDPI